MHRIVRPAGWPQGKGYADGILTEDGHLFVGGQVGWTPEHVFVSNDFVAQMEQALTNIVAIVEAAGGKAEHIVRLTGTSSTSANTSPASARSAKPIAAYSDATSLRWRWWLWPALSRTQP